MRISKALPRLLLCAIFVASFSSCDEYHLTSDKGISVVTRGEIFGRQGRDLPEGIPESSSWDYPYLDIIAREFIPRNDFFETSKCLAWRITWPDYDNSADNNKIPTVFGVNGALSSFNYLNSVDPANTHDKVFSLYYNEKVEAAAALWAELDYSDPAIMEVPTFVLSDQPLANIIDWVTKRPSLFKIHWPGGGSNDLDYGEGDFIQFHLRDADLYGGIRIVSMEPRTIEVYLAVPNY